MIILRIETGPKLKEKQQLDEFATKYNNSIFKPKKIKSDDEGGNSTRGTMTSKWHKDGEENSSMYGPMEKYCLTLRM